MTFNKLLLYIVGFIVAATFLQVIIIYVASDAKDKQEIKNSFFKIASLKEFFKMLGSFMFNSNVLFIVLGISFVGLILFFKAC